MKALPLTVFKDVFAKAKHERAMTLLGLAKLIRTASAPTKSKLQLLKLATFGDKASKENCLRHDGNVLAISGIEVDYDGEEIPFKEAVATLKERNLIALAYTTPSHTPAKPRWRVLLPTSETLPADQRSKLVARLNGIFDGRLATESFTLSLSVYFGHAKDNPTYEVAVVDDEFLGSDYIDKRDDLDLEAIEAPEKGQSPAVDPKIDWAKVETLDGWCKSASDLPDHFLTKGKDIVDFKGGIKALNAQLREKYDGHKTYGSWSSVPFALALMAKQAGLTNEQVAALLRCDLPCNQHVRKFESDRDQQRAITRSIMRSRNPPLVLSRASPLQSARLCAARAKRPLIFDADVFYEWQTTHYQALSDTDVNKRLYGFLEPAKREFEVKKEIKQGPFNPARDDVEKVKHALKTVVCTPSRLSPPVWLKGEDRGQIIACANGLLRLADRVLLDHTPDYFNTSALDFAYDPKAPKPKVFLQFLVDVWGEDAQAIDTLQEMFGYILSGDRSHQKIFMLVGPKRAGKSTIGQLLHKLVGPNGSTGSSLLSLSTRFGLQPLINKSLVVMPDERIEGGIRSPHVTTALLKVSGGDVVTVDRKLIAPWTGVIAVCFVIITNEVPAMRDNSGALASRFIVLQFKETFLGREDKGLLDKLQAELPGILDWSIEGWHRLQERGAFVQPESGKESVRLLEDMGSPISAFVDEHCKVGADCKVPTRALFEAYREWANANGHEHGGTERSFGRDLQSALPNVERHKVGPRRARAWHYIGIELT